MDLNKAIVWNVSRGLILDLVKYAVFVKKISDSILARILVLLNVEIWFSKKIMNNAMMAII